MESFRRVSDDASGFLASIPYAADRSLVAERLAEVESTRRAHKQSLFPIAAANLVVGCAILIFSWGLLSRRDRARVMTVQLLGVQAVLDVVEYALTPELRGRVLALASSYLDAQAHAASEALSPEILEALRQIVLRAPAVGLGVGLVSHLLTAVPLLRQDVKEFCLASATEEADGGGSGDDE